MTDYGHALAIVDRLRRQAEINKEQGAELYPGASDEAANELAEQIKTCDWRCRKCGAISHEAKQSACEHSFTWDYDMVET